MKNYGLSSHLYAYLYAAVLLFTIGLLGLIYTKDHSAFGIATLKETITLFNDQQITLWASTEKFKNGREYYWLTKNNVALNEFESLQQYLVKEPKINCGKINHRNDKIWFVICLNGMQKDQLLKKIRHWEIRA